MKTSFDRYSCLNSLKADFAKFRTHSRSHARIPDHLRRAVLDGLAAGLDVTLVTTALKLTTAQIALWQRRRKVAVMAEERPRILNVIPTSAGSHEPTGLRVSYEAGRLLLELSF